MCGAAAWALSASGLSHFSITTNVSGPNGVWNLPMSGVSVAGPYSMQPFSACTAGILARNSRRMASRRPGLAVMMAMTWIMESSSELAVGFATAMVRVGYESGDLDANKAFEQAN